MFMRIITGARARRKQINKLLDAYLHLLDQRDRIHSAYITALAAIEINKAVEVLTPDVIKTLSLENPETISTDELRVFYKQALAVNDADKNSVSHSILHISAGNLRLKDRLARRKWVKHWIREYEAIMRNCLQEDKDNGVHLVYQAKINRIKKFTFWSPLHIFQTQDLNEAEATANWL